MKALAIDCAVSKLTIAAKDDNHQVKLSLNIGMKQSEKILPAIDFVLNEIGLTTKDLDYTTVTLGPGTFTGLRLGLSALKALELANKTPIYGIPTLDAYAYPYRTAIETVLPVVDGNREMFFSAFYLRGEKISAYKDSSIEDILNEIDPETDVLVCGPDAPKFVALVKEKTPLYAIHCFTPETDACESLFEIAEKMIEEKKPALAEYEGPMYLRKSEAEIVYESKKASE